MSLKLVTPAAGQRVLPELEHGAVLALTLKDMLLVVTHMRQAPGDLFLDIAFPAQTTLGVVADQIGHRRPDLQQRLRIVE